MGAAIGAPPTTIAAARHIVSARRESRTITLFIGRCSRILDKSGNDACSGTVAVHVPETNAPSEHPDVSSVERFIAAPPDRIFDVLADPSRHQEVDGSGTVKGSPEGSQRLVLGSKFGMSMKMGLSYSMVNTVVEFEENRRIAWQPRPSVKVMSWFVGGRIWRYQLEPQDGGTLVRESWDISQEVHPWTVRPLRSKTIDAMTKTLERLDEVVTA
jgi:uncharacterized protein YndB with AHSA1/START domain